MQVYLRRTIRGLVPADELSEAALRKIAVGQDVRAEIARPRNPRSVQQLRLYWKLMQVVCDSSDHFKDREQVSDFLKLQTGHYETTQIVMDGKPYEWRRPKSIAFDRLSHEDFQDYWNRALDVICARIIPGIGKRELEHEVYDLLGMAEAAE